MAPSGSAAYSRAVSANSESARGDPFICVRAFCACRARSAEGRAQKADADVRLAQGQPLQVGFVIGFDLGLRRLDLRGLEKARQVRGLQNRLLAVAQRAHHVWLLVQSSAPGLLRDDLAPHPLLHDLPPCRRAVQSGRGVAHRVLQTPSPSAPRRRRGRRRVRQRKRAKRRRRRTLRGVRAVRIRRARDTLLRGGRDGLRLAHLARGVGHVGREPLGVGAGAEALAQEAAAQRMSRISW